MSSLLTTQALTKRFGGLIAVNNVDFHIEEGETVGIIGPNGSGTTTFFNLLTGFFTPTAGQITFQNRNITKMSPERRTRLGITRTFQLVSVFNSLRVWENLVPCVIQKSLSYRSQWRFMTSLAERLQTDCSEALKLVGLENHAESKTSELSYGDKRLLEIAMSLSLKPRLLLLDEPLAGLSDVEIVKILSLLKTFKGKITIAIVEHKISTIVDFVDRLCVMNEGHLIREGKPLEVLRDPLVNECYWGRQQETSTTDTREELSGRE